MLLLVLQSTNFGSESHSVDTPRFIETLLFYSGEASFSLSLFLSFSVSADCTFLCTLLLLCFSCSCSFRSLSLLLAAPSFTEFSRNHKKEDERRAKQMAADKEIRDGTNAALAEADKYSKEANALQIELDRLQKEKDRLGREAFDLAKQVEAAKVERRNAELESQRMIEMIARRASDSSLVRMPAPPAPAPARGS